MPRFPVAFGKRRSTAVIEDFENAQIAQPSFRVLDRTDVVAGRPFDGNARMARATQSLSYPPPQRRVEMAEDDNMFADLKTNRYVYLGAWCLYNTLPTSFGAAARNFPLTLVSSPAAEPPDSASCVSDLSIS
jgi:hypothetical protein